MTADPIPATITAIDPLTSDTSLFSVHLEPAPLPTMLIFSPGQFVQVSVPHAGEAPISLASSPASGDSLALCVRQVGRVTSRLHKAVPGQRISIRGPFGTGFPVDEMAGSDVLLIAGGLGIAPLRSLLHHLLDHRHLYGEITLMYGAREPAAMLFRDELAKLSAGNLVRVMLTVDFLRQGEYDRLLCNIGLLPALLHGIRFDGKRTVAAICGPPALYRCIIPELLEAGCTEDRILLSLERRMQCGQGYCSHCAVGDLLCCTDGPVFRYRDIKAIPGAI